MRTPKTQISLSIRPFWSESSMSPQWVAKDPSFLHVDSKDWSDWADALADLSSLGAHAILLVLSWGGSYTLLVHHMPAVEILLTGIFPIHTLLAFSSFQIFWCKDVQALTRILPSQDKPVERKEFLPYQTEIYTVNNSLHLIENKPLYHMSHNTRKPVFGVLRPSMTQTSLLSFLS